DQGKPKEVRLPISVLLPDTHSSGGGAWIGAGDRAKSIMVRVSDSALGISLAERTRRACPAGGPCPLWLEGAWRGKQDGEWRFDVFKVLRVVSEEEIKQ